MNEEAIAVLEAKLKAREDRPGFKANADAIRARIEALKATPAERPVEPPADPPAEVIDLGTFN